jgi:hypothetical protein
MKDEAVARGLGGGAAEDGEGEGVGLDIGAAARGRDERAVSGGGIPAGCVGVTGCGGGRGVRGVVLVGDFFFYFHFFVNHISRKEIGQFFF